jgi:hypothetical protein
LSGALQNVDKKCVILGQAHFQIIKKIEVANTFRFLKMKQQNSVALTKMNTFYLAS